MPRVRPWPDPLWTPGSPGFDERPYGIGPGELRLAWVLGAVVRGARGAYDLDGPAGQRWEVKQLDASGRFGTGAEGMPDFLEFSTRSRELAQCLERFAAIFADDPVARRENEKEFPDVSFEEIERFVDTTFPEKIEKGEISRGTVLGGTRLNPRGIKQMIESFCEFTRVCDKLGAWKPTDRQRLFGLELTYADIARTARALGSSGREMVRRARVPLPFLAAAELDHPWFRGSSLEDDWKKIVPSRSFALVDGIYFVDEAEGYAYVPTGELDAVASFDSFSRRMSKFKIKRLFPSV